MLEIVKELKTSMEIKTRKRGNQGSRKKAKRKYIDLICAFDIETTRLEEIDQSIMYIWQLQLGLPQDDGLTIYGRSWDEFSQLLHLLTEGLDENVYYCIWVHNLSYEFQFLAGIFHFLPENVFCMESRRILKCDCLDHIEFRCSYIHSNMSLDEYTHKWKVEMPKIHGFDYGKKRYPWTELTDDELLYCLNDVRGLVQALHNEMEFDNDDLYTIPLTSTGYVRRDVKKSMRTYNHETLRRQLPNMEVYNLLRSAFRGGNTHANRYFSGAIIGDEIMPYKVYSFDRSSSYPGVCMNHLYPIGRWQEEKDLSFDRCLELMKRRGKALLLQATFTNIRLRDPLWGFPYLSISKVSEFVPDDLRRTYDNGRILASKMLSTTITDIDLKIICEEYEYDDIIINQMYSSTYGKLPGQLTDEIEKYYRLKTELKGVEGSENLYMKSKNKLNSTYGMIVQDPCKPEILYMEDNYDEIKGNFLENLEKDKEWLLDHYRKNAFLNYAWGVWVTAWARYELEEGLKIVHKPDLGSYGVYTDTDSVKFVCDNNEILKQVFKEFETYNKKKQKLSKASGAYAKDPKGKYHYMEVYEEDGVYNKFSTLGSKKYCYEENGELHITIAGVGKKKGAEELKKKGGINAFKKDLIFVEAGGLESVYNDYPEMTEVEIDGHKVEIVRNVCLKPSTYQLSTTWEYEFIMNHPQAYLDVFTDDFPS